MTAVLSPPAQHGVLHPQFCSTSTWSTWREHVYGQSALTLIQFSSLGCWASPSCSSCSYQTEGRYIIRSLYTCTVWNVLFRFRFALCLQVVSQIVTKCILVVFACHFVRANSFVTLPLYCKYLSGTFQRSLASAIVNSRCCLKAFSNTCSFLWKAQCILVIGKNIVIKSVDYTAYNTASRKS